MKFSLDKQEKYTVFTVMEDKIDSNISANLKSEFVTLNAEGTSNIILDLSQVRYIDSSGLSAILIGNRLCKDAHGMFVITSPSDHVMKLLKISQLDKTLNILPTNAEAVDAVFMNEIERDLNSGE